MGQWLSSTLCARVAAQPVTGSDMTRARALQARKPGEKMAFASGGTLNPPAAAPGAAHSPGIA